MKIKMIPTTAKPTSNSFHFPAISQQTSFIPAIFLPITNPNLCKYRSNRAVLTAIRNSDNIPTSSRDSRWSLQGMTALVTGGSRGIGFSLSPLLFNFIPISSLIVKCIQVPALWESSDFLGSNFRLFCVLGEICRHAIVEEFVGFGATVHTCARNEGELDNCLKGWENQGFNVTGSVCDVSSREQRERLLHTVSSVFNGKLNILINNVGTNIRKPMIEFTPEEFSILMTTNFESVFHLSQLAYPLLKASGCGSVVFISSVSGFVSLKSMSAQGATKGAINQLTRNLACEWAKDNIRSNAVAPWYIKTSLVEKVLSNEEYLEEVYSRTPLRRLGDPKEVSSLVAFLCLPAAAYITGQVICIDGGMSINGFYPRIDFQ